MYAGLESLQQFRHASPSGTISFSPLPSAGSPAHPQMASIFDVIKPIWTFGELTPLLALAISPDAPLASWDFLASRIIFPLALKCNCLWMILLRQPFALAFPAGTSELHSHRTASGQASSHMLGPTSASGGMRQVGRDERTGWNLGWITVRGHIQPNVKIRGEDKQEVNRECFRASNHSECTPRCYCNLLLPTSLRWGEKHSGAYTKWCCKVVQRLKGVVE